MSHWTNINVQIRSLESARAACRELGVDLIVAQPGQQVQARGYNGLTRSAEAMIKLAGPYDVALNRQADGTYTMACDFWGGHVAKQLGKNCQKFTQLYGVHQAIRSAPRGAIARRVMGAKGAINVILTMP